MAPMSHDFAPELRRQACTRNPLYINDLHVPTLRIYPVRFQGLTNVVRTRTSACELVEKLNWLMSYRPVRIYCISKLMHRKNNGEAIGPVVPTIEPATSQVQVANWRRKGPAASQTVGWAGPHGRPGAGYGLPLVEMHAATVHAIYLTWSSPCVPTRKFVTATKRDAACEASSDVGPPAKRDRVHRDRRMPSRFGRLAARERYSDPLGLNEAGGCEALGISMSLRSEERRWPCPYSRRRRGRQRTIPRRRSSRAWSSSTVHRSYWERSFSLPTRRRAGAACFYRLPRCKSWWQPTRPMGQVGGHYCRSSIQSVVGSARIGLLPVGTQ